MPRIYKCKNCGLHHAAPTGKQCKNGPDKGESNVMNELLPVLMDIKNQLANMKDHRSRVERTEETDATQESELVEDSENSETEQEETQAAGADDDSPITPQELRKDIRAMRKAAKRIARLQSDDSDEEEPGEVRKSRRDGKKSGSMLTANEVVKERIDWPHMYIKRVVGGKKIGVDYKDLSMAEFVYGFLSMLESPKCKMDKDVMLGILRMMMLDSIDFPWENARSFYQLVGIDVETGDREWTDTEEIRDLRMMHSRVAAKEKTDKTPSGGRQKSSTVRCCALYQKKNCEHNRDHMPFTHVCAYCYRVTGMSCRHPEDECFRKVAEEAKNGQKRE